MATYSICKYIEINHMMPQILMMKCTKEEKTTHIGLSLAVRKALPESDCTHDMCIMSDVSVLSAQ